MRRRTTLLRHGAFIRIGTVDLNLKCPFHAIADEEETSGMLKGRTDTSFFLINL